MNIKSLILLTPRFIKQILVLIIDILSSILSLLITLYLLNLNLNLVLDVSLIIFFISFFSFIPFAIYLGLYKGIFRFSGLYSITRIFFTCNIYFFIFYIYIHSSNQKIIEPSLAVVILQVYFLFFLMASTRTLIVLIYSFSNNFNFKPVAIIYGAGSRGYKFYKQNNDKYNFIGYIDDNDKLVGTRIDKIEIFDKNYFDSLVNKYNVDYLFVSFSSISKKTKNRIHKLIDPYNIGLKILDETDNKRNFVSKKINEVDINSIVNREIHWNKTEIQKLINSNNILVTGGGGSIGSELCRQLIKYNPNKIIVFDNSEFNLYKLNHEIAEIIKKNNLNCNLEFILGDLSDLQFLEFLFSKNNINIVFHAAAYKHVPLLEENILYAVRNNIFNTLNLINICLKNKVKNFTFISTDKAVRSTNIMGATKRFSEIILQSYFEKFSSKNNITFTIVRFGNVFASRGSAVPLFIDQVEKGGPVTITDKLITRYFMSTIEAVGLVLESTHISKGGEVFVLNMGEPIKIYYLIKKIIQLSGFTEKTKEKPLGDIEVQSIGLRPGEKLYEELLIGNNPISTSNPNIFKANEQYIDYDKLIIEIENLKKSFNQNNINNCIEILKKNCF